MYGRLTIEPEASFEESTGQRPAAHLHSGLAAGNPPDSPEGDASADPELELIDLAADEGWEGFDDAMSAC